MGSLCPATTAGSGARHSATTWRANEKTEGRRVDGERRTQNEGGVGDGERERKRVYFALACSFM